MSNSEVENALLAIARAAGTLRAYSENADFIGDALAEQARRLADDLDSARRVLRFVRESHK